MNPNFLIGVGVVALLLILVGILAAARADLETTQTELSKIEHRIKQAEQDVEEVRRQRACSQFWKQALQSLDGVATNRILWSRQWETLALSVPDDMTLTVFGARGVDVPVASGGDSNVICFGTRYEARFQGRVLDQRASAIIRRFTQDLTAVPGFKGILESVELSSEKPLREKERRGKEFIVTANYRAIDWRTGEEQ